MAKNLFCSMQIVAIFLLFALVFEFHPILCRWLDEQKEMAKVSLDAPV